LTAMSVVFGLTYHNVVMLDLDGMSFREVKRLCMEAVRRYRLGGFVILRSSRNNYHVVFDRTFKTWDKTLNIMSRIAIMSKNPNVWKWLCMQVIKGGATLRISPKPSNPGFKPPPRVVFRHGNQDTAVKKYLADRRWVLKSVRRIGVYS